MSFIKLNNNIFTVNLSPKALLVYAFLKSKTKFKSLVISVTAIAATLKLDPKTIRNAVAELAKRFIITIHKRYNARGNLASRYTINDCIGTNTWFAVPREIFTTNIKPYDFMVYCYIVKCMGHNGAFPSLTNISTNTRVSKSKVITAVRYLYEFTFINRIRRKYKLTMAFRHNRYIKFRHKKRAYNRYALIKISYSKIQLYYIIVERMCQVFCKNFFKSRGSPYFP